MRQKVVYWRNLSNQPEPTKKIEYQPPKPKTKTKIIREKRSFSSENYNKLLTIIAILVIVSLFLGIVEYLRRFSLTESFVFVTSYLIGILSIGIYAVRFALFSELPRFKTRNEGRLTEYKPSISKSVANPHVSIKPVEPQKEENQQKEEEKSDELQGEERLKLKKRLKERGNVFVFKEDLRLTKEERKKKEEGEIGYSHLYYNEPLEDSTQFHDRIAE